MKNSLVLAILVIALVPGKATLAETIKITLLNNAPTQIEMTRPLPLRATLRMPGAASSFEKVQQHLQNAAMFQVTKTEGNSVGFAVLVSRAKSQGSDIVVQLFGTGGLKQKGSIAVRDLVVGGDTYHFETETPGQSGATYAFGKDVSVQGVWSPPKLDLDWNHWKATARASGTFFPPSQVRTGKEAKAYAISLDANIPLQLPADLKGIVGANKSASSQTVDSLTLTAQQFMYSGAGYRTIGLRYRATSAFAGQEAVLVYAPFFSMSKKNDRVTALELEVGLRDGDAEWKNLTTLAPPRGNTVARVGGLLEYAPTLGPINRNLSTGARFFVRGRGWADRFKNDIGKDGDWRLRGYVDSELFWNFSPTRRVYVRYENGSLPPDLTKRVDRFSFGAGVAF